MGQHAARRQKDDDAELPVGRLLFPLSVVTRSTAEERRSENTRALTADTDLGVLMHALIGGDERSPQVTGRAESTRDVDAQLADVLKSVGLSNSSSARAVDSSTGHDEDEIVAGVEPRGNDSGDRGVRGWLRLLGRSDGTQREESRGPIDHGDSIRHDDVPSHRDPALAPVRPAMRRPFIASRFTQWVCALRGHDQMMSFESGRLFLRCTSCGHESPGWTPGERRLIVKWHTARRPASVAQFPEVGRAWILPHHAAVASGRRRA